MALKLMYITNNADVALIAEKYGVDRIWVRFRKPWKRRAPEGNEFCKI